MILLPSVAYWKMLKQLDHLLEMSLVYRGGHAEMAMSHFSEPRVNTVSQHWLLVSAVHVAAPLICLNCYLLMA